MPDSNIIIRIEEATINTWPSIQTYIFCGWVVRIGDGYTGRANSIYPLYESRTDLKTRITACEHIFEANSLPTAFKMTRCTAPDELDVTLLPLGYHSEKPTTIYTYDLSETNQGTANPAEQSNVQVFDSLNEDWFIQSTQAEGYSPEDTSMYRDLLSRIHLPVRYVTVMDGDRPVAWGLAIIDREMVGLFRLFVQPDMRRKGLGEILTNVLLAWGSKNASKTAFLQVLESNMSARNFYEHLGFEYAYTYWYRIKR